MRRIHPSPSRNRSAQAFARYINRPGPRPIEFYSEFLDALRFSGPSYESEFVAFINEKYRGRRPDLVVTVFPEALQFVERHRADLWPDTPVVFVGIPDDWPARQAPPAGITGVLTRVDFSGTIELAMRLQPAARRVVVVSGASGFDQLWRAGAEAALSAYSGRLEASYLSGPAISDIVQAVAQLPQDSFVLYTTVFRDANGPAVPNDVAKLITAASTVPVYSVFEPTLGTGIVGGSSVKLEAQAARAGALALAILNGARPESLPVEPSPPAVPRVDWRQLQRFGISESLLPTATVVVHRPTSFWALYRGRIIGAAIVVALQSMLIVALLIERRQRRRAELRSRRQSVELAHASRLATVGEITASIGHQVNQPLCAILNNTAAAEMLLEVRPLPLDELRQILADIRRDDERASEVIRSMRALLQRTESHMQPVDLNLVISQVLQFLDGEARRHRVVINADLAADMPRVLGDQVHLQQVVLNLVMNAMEAASSRSNGSGGRVSVRTCLDHAGTLEVAVTDTGAGIAAEQLPRLFESFYTTKKNGMGLGLSIARSIVESHGGRISAENHPAGGATFRFVLPAEGRSLAAPPSPYHHPGS